MIEIAGITPKEIVPGYQGRFIHTEKMTIAFWEVEAGAVMPLHHHVHEQVSQVLEGKFELTVDGVTHCYEPGTIVVIPSNIVHGGMALTPCKLLDVFSPLRTEYQ